MIGRIELKISGHTFQFILPLAKGKLLQWHVGASRNVFTCMPIVVGCLKNYYWDHTVCFGLDWTEFNWIQSDCLVLYILIISFP